MRTPSARRRDAGFSLLEVTVALGLATFCFVAIFGLLPVGLKINQVAKGQTVANNLLSEVAADLRAAPGAAPSAAVTTSQHFGIPISDNTAASTTTLYFTESGAYSTVARSGYPYRLTVTFLPLPGAGAATAKLATWANLKISWSGQASTNTANDSVETFLALDRN